MAQEQDVKVRVGILTDGKARIEGHRILNAVMGHGFHWQQCYELLLPPEAEFAAKGRAAKRWLACLWRCICTAWWPAR